ncbi:MAG: outer membrane beta-barrel protein [Bacteroidia bacterium]
MNTKIYSFFLFWGFLSSCLFVSAQKLSLGGKLGSTIIKSENSISTQSSEAGIFATYTTQNFKLGLQLEVNYLKWNEKNSFASNHEFQMPLLGVMPLDRRNRISLHAGPYLGVGSAQPSTTMSAPGRDWSWGLKSGVRFRLPVNDNISLVSDARLGCEVARSPSQPYLQEGIGSENYTLPLQRQFSFHFSIGIDFKSGKKKAFRIKRDMRKKPVLKH